jgi:anti-anti-sigma factor
MCLKIVSGFVLCTVLKKQHCQSRRPFLDDGTFLFPSAGLKRIFCCFEFLTLMHPIYSFTKNAGPDNMKPVNPQGDRRIKLVTYPESHGLQARLLSMMQEPDLSILHLDGPIDKTNAGYFKNILSDIMDRNCTNVILNFSDVTCISGLAWIYIATLAQRFKSVNGTLCIANMGKNAQESLAMVPIDLDIDRYPTVEDAIAFFGSDDYIIIADPPVQENDSISNQPTERIYIKEPSLNAKPVRNNADSGCDSGDPFPGPDVEKKKSGLKPLPIAPVVNETLIKAKLPDGKALKAALPVADRKQDAPDSKPQMPDQLEPRSTAPEKDHIPFPLKNGLCAELHVISTEVPVVHELRVLGTIEHQNASYFDAMLSDILDRRCNNVILNFAELTYASSAAWGILASAAQRFKSISGFFCIAHLSDSVDELFRVLQFDAIIDKYPTTDDAIAHFKRINTPASSNQPVRKEITNLEPVIRKQAGDSPGSGENRSDVKQSL